MEKPIRKSIGRALFYHLGSIAFASLVVALVKFIRIMLEVLNVIEEYLKKGISKKSKLKWASWSLLKLLELLCEVF